MKRVGGRFTLERGLAVGGVATVYLGRDEVLDRPVAVKILHAGFEGSDLAARFEREGSMAAKLSHPNVVQVYDAGKDAAGERETSYIVMEYVPGGDLKGLVEERGPLPEAELVKVGASLAAGLAHAHARGVVHRDIKPQNVLIDEYGRPKLTDFGIARALDATVQTTKTGSYLGTALYSSPEQLKGAEITPKSDVYSLGATLYEAMVGEPMFEGTVFQVANRQIHDPPVPPGERGAEVSAGFEAAIFACLAKDPSDRPDAAELRDRLERLAAGEEEPAGRAGRGRRGIVTAVSAVLLLVGALGAMAMLRSGDEGAGGGQPEQVSQQVPPEDAGAEGSGVPGEEEAAGTVAAMYLAVVRGDYERSYEALSEEYRRAEFPTREDWEENFSGLRAITFTETPTARVSGERAVVTGETASITSDGEAMSGSGVWHLVVEDGEWKLDGMEVREQREERGGDR